MSSFIIYEIIFGRLCLDVGTLSGYFGTSPLWT
jgi:hypothetical protein